MKQTKVKYLSLTEKISYHQGLLLIYEHCYQKHNRIRIRIHSLSNNKSSTLTWIVLILIL